MKRWLLLVALYLACGVLDLVVVNATAHETSRSLIFILAAAAALVLGWMAPRFWVLSVAAPWLLLPIAHPFGVSNEATPGGDDGTSVTTAAWGLALVSTALILLGAGARHLYERRRARRAPRPREPENA